METQLEELEMQKVLARWVTGCMALAGLMAMVLLSPVTIQAEVCEKGNPKFVAHPADVNGDRRITMGEANAYLKCWQQDSCLMSYAIRAAYLQRNGERYAYNGSLEPPLCWILPPPERRADEFFITTEGHGVRYHVTDSQGNKFDDYAWAVFQKTNENHDFVLTLNAEEPLSWNNSLGGYIARPNPYDGQFLTCINWGAPSRNQGHFFMNFSLPQTFVSGDTWMWTNKSYSVELLGATAVGGIEFQDCVRVNIDDSTNSSQLWAGTGYFIVAAGVGIVEIEFNRSADGSQVRFLYMADQQFPSHAISGKVTVNGTPAVGKVVQIHNYRWGTRAITDESGKFSLQAYGPDLILRIGDDADDDGFLDFEADWPKEWKVEDIDKDTYVEIKLVSSSEGEGEPEDEASLIHNAAWLDLAASSVENKLAKMGIYSSRSLLVKHPEVYLQADAVWLEKIATVYDGWAAEYLHRDRVDDESYWDQVASSINDGFRFDNKEGSAFSWSDFKWAHHRHNAVSYADSLPENAPFHGWLDLRLPLLWNGIKGIGWTTPNLTLAEALYFQLRTQGKSVYLAVSDAGFGYVIESNGSGAQLYDPLVATQAGKIDIQGKFVLVMNQDAVWYPLMGRDDTGVNAGLRNAVEAYCMSDAEPALNSLELAVLDALTEGTQLDSDMDKHWAAFFASRLGNQWGWRAAPVRTFSRSLFPERFVECADTYTDIPQEIVALNMAVTELGNRLSPLAAILAAEAKEQVGSGLTKAFMAISDRYRDWFKREDNDWVYGEYYRMWLPNLDDKWLSGVGNCFVEACNVGAAMQLVAAPDWDVWITNWWDTTDRGGHVIAGVYTPTEARTLSNGLYRPSDGACLHGPLWTIHGRVAYPLIYRSSAGFLASGQNCNGYCFDPLEKPFTNLDYGATNDMLGAITAYEPDFQFVSGNYSNLQTMSAQDYTGHVESLETQWEIYQLPPTQRASVTVPNLIGLTEVECVGALATPELLLRTIGTQENLSYPAGTVISQTPVHGASTSRGKAVDVILSSGPAERRADEFFITTEGHGIRYHVTDSQGGKFDDYAWAVFQKTNEDKDFVVTLNAEGSTWLGNSLGGHIDYTFDGYLLTLMNSGAPVTNQGQFFMHFTLPQTFVSGDTWTWINKSYSVELLGTAVVGGIEFQDCVRVNIDDSTNSSQYWAGTGYFIVAAGVGVVEIEFNRSADGSQVRFLYMADQQFTAHTISGKVTVNGTPAVGKVVQIHNRSWGIRAITDGLGEFSLQAYGPDLFLRIGDDADNDGRLDFEADWPKEWKVEGIDKDTYVEVKF